MLLLVIAAGARAEYNRMVFRTAEGEPQWVGLENLNITFVDGNMVATSEDRSVVIPLASLVSMEFGSGESGVGAIPAGELSAGSVTVYTADGIQAGSYDSAAAACAALQSGVYIFKAGNGQTSKIMINR